MLTLTKFVTFDAQKYVGDMYPIGTNVLILPKQSTKSKVPPSIVNVMASIQLHSVGKGLGVGVGVGVGLGVIHVYNSNLSQPSPSIILTNKDPDVFNGDGTVKV